MLSIGHSLLLIAASGIAYSILLLPLAYAVAGPNAVRSAATAGAAAFVLATFVVRVPENVGIVERHTVYFVIAVFSGFASVTNVWVLRSQFALRGAVAITAFGTATIVISIALASFAWALIGQTMPKTGVVEKPVWAVALCITLSVIGALSMPTELVRPLPQWSSIGIVAVVVILAMPAMSIGWRGGRRGREWLQGAARIWQTLKRIGPPLGFAVTGYLFLGALFGTFHAAIWQQSHSAYEPMDMQGGLGEFLYFSFVTLATVGYGDIHPQSGPARFCTVAEVLCGVVWTVLVVGVVLSRATAPPSASINSNGAASPTKPGAIIQGPPPQAADSADSNE